MKNKKQLLAYANVRDLFENANKYGKGHYLLMQTAIKENRNLVLSLGLKETESDPNLEVIKSKYESGKISVNKAIKMVDKWLYQFVKADKSFDWNTLTEYLGRNQISHIIQELGYLMPDEVYWKLLGNAYQDSDFAFENMKYIKSFMLSKRPKRESIMNEEEQLFFNNLPNEVIIYRGCSLNEIESKQYRYSWSLDKEVACFFAFKYHRNDGIECGVIEKKVSKNSLLAYFNDRAEAEVIYVHSGL